MNGKIPRNYLTLITNHNLLAFAVKLGSYANHDIQGRRAAKLYFSKLLNKQIFFCNNVH